MGEKSQSFRPSCGNRTSSSYCFNSSVRTLLSAAFQDVLGEAEERVEELRVPLGRHTLWNDESKLIKLHQCQESRFESDFLTHTLLIKPRS